ncbi:MAG: pyridoxal-phosphate dependent enzyme, partial [Nesterenkonia sp.]|nr:pyridoxal-phosphate dependent enzyme [Nesterenkonia sp.]
PASHYESTGPEIWEDTEGRITHLVVGAGTGGTVTGTGRYLQEVSRGREGGPVRVVVADPDGSIFSGGEARPYFVEGVGEDIMVDNYDPDVPDAHERVTDAESFAMARRLATEEGLLVGGSSGTAVVAALRVAEGLAEDDVVVAILPDSGRGYLGKIFNDRWMADHGFGAAAGGASGSEVTVSSSEEVTRAVADGRIAADRNAGTDSGESAEPTAADLLAAKRDLLGSVLPDVVSVSRTTVLREAVSVMNRYGVDIVPIIDRPGTGTRIGEVHGVVDLARLSEQLISGEASVSDTVAQHLDDALPLIGATEPVSEVLQALRRRPTLLVALEGEIIGVLTRNDLLAHLSTKES